MTFIIGLFSNDNIQRQIFGTVFIVAVLCSILANPIDRRDADYRLDNPSKDIQSETDKVISELKAKILSRLNLKDVPKINRSFDWNNIPEEMKMLLNQEVISEDVNSETSNSNTETMITTLRRIDSTHDNLTDNHEFFNLTIPNLDNVDIVYAKLIIPLVQSAFENSIQGNIIYHVTVDKQSELTSNLSINSANGNSVTIDWTPTLRTLIDDDDNFQKIRTKLSWTISITGINQTVPVTQMIDTEKIVLEIQYKGPANIVRKKRSSDTACVENNLFCCTQTLRVNVEDLGWTGFILAPRAFEINYCRGLCNNYLRYISNHVKVVNFIQKKGASSKREIKSCCVPYSYKNLTIMYLRSDNSLGMATFNDLIASTCGCL